MRFKSGAIIPILVMLSVLFVPPLWAQDRTADPKVLAETILKLVSFEKHCSGESSEITVYVLGSEEVAEELDKMIGTRVGNATLKKVEKGTELPDDIPDVFYIGDDTKLFSTIMFTRTQKVLSVTGLTHMAEKGVTLNIAAAEDGSPSITLNLTASKEEDLDWNPAILKIARAVH